jgi:glycosyltransferase involved in cell wall biosynthesis
MPTFSIIITFYNQKAFIRDAVGSALAQGSPGKEVIIIDDGSEDGSNDILAEYGDTIKIQVLERNEGASAARNWGASLASGDFLVFLDGDDILLPWALNVYGRIIELKNPKLILSKMVWFKGRFSPAAVSNAPREISVVDYEAFMKKDRAYRVSASAMVVDRESFLSVGGWSTDIWPMEDHDLLMRLGYSGRTIQILSPPTTAYRVHESNTVNQLHKMFGSLCKLLRKERSGQYPGGAARRLERLAVLGGVAAFYLRRAFDERFYADGLKLLAASWPFVLVALLRRFVAVLQGRHLVESVSLSDLQGE